MSLPDSTLRTAVVQLRSTHDRDLNLQRAASLVAEAAAQGARLVILPENFSYLDREGRKIKFAETDREGPSVDFTREAAVKHGIYLVAGSIPLRAENPDRTTNTMLVAGPDGSFVARYDKIHLFDINLDHSHAFRESRYVEPGDTMTVVDIDDWRVGLSICYDLRFPELYRSLVDQGAHLLLVPSAFTAKTGEDHWEILIRARAIENQCYVAAAAQWGQHNDVRESWGHSLLVDPWGIMIAGVESGEGVAVADLDPKRLASVREALPALEHRRVRGNRTT